MTEACITDAMWQAAMGEGHDLNTAQGRAAFDARLRAELVKIEDASLRGHAAEILRGKRSGVFAPADDDVLRRLLVIEKMLGIGRGREITRLTRG